MQIIEKVEIVKSDDEDDIENYENLAEEIAVYEIGGPLFFASAKQYAEQIHESAHSAEILIIRMRYVNFIDSTALHNFKGTLLLLKENGTTIITSGTNNTVFEDLKKHKIIDIITPEHMHKTFPRAVAHAHSLLEHKKL